MRKKKISFKKLLNIYLDIKGLEIIVFLRNGKEIELNKNRRLIENEIVVMDKFNNEMRIPLASIKSIDLYAA